MFRISLIFLVGAAAVAAQADAAPEVIVGTWSSTEVRTTQFQDRATGAFSRPSGATISYTVRPDGTYVRQTLLQTFMYNCTDVVFVTESGRVSRCGDALVFASTGGRLKSSDNCNARFNYAKEIPAREYVYTPWLLRQGQFGPELCLADTKNKLCYRKKADK